MKQKKSEINWLSTMQEGFLLKGLTMGAHTIHEIYGKTPKSGRVHRVALQTNDRKPPSFTIRKSTNPIFCSKFQFLTIFGIISSNFTFVGPFLLLNALQTSFKFDSYTCYLPHLLYL